MNIIINFHNPRAQDNYDTSYSFDKEKQFWDSVAPRYKDNELVYYELVNEPTSSMETFEKSGFKDGLMSVYNSVRSSAPDREVLMFSFNTIDNQIVEVVEEYKEEIDWDKTSVAYHMYNLNNSAAVQTLMTDYRVICTQWDYSFVNKDGDNDIREVDGYEENSQTLEAIRSSWVDWRQWDDTTLNELLDTLISDARIKNYWWGKPIPGMRVTGINIMQDSVKIMWGSSVQLNGQVYPALSEDQTIIWYSTNPNLMTIDANGYVTTRTAVRTDTVFVFATSHDGGYKDSCRFILYPSEDKCAYPNCTPHDIPGQINATHFDQGGEGIGYHDTTQGNDGDGPRQDEDVDTDYKLSEGAITYIATDEWLEYTIDVKETSEYNIEILFATPSRFGKFHIEIDGINVSGTVYAKASGSLTEFRPTVVENIKLTEGLHLLRIFFDYAYYNMGTITITDVTTGINDPVNISDTRIYPNPVKDKLYISGKIRFNTYSVTTITGVTLVHKDLNEDRTVNVSLLPKGYYIIILYSDNKTRKLQFIKY
jgi:hypothetical protein